MSGGRGWRLTPQSGVQANEGARNRWITIQLTALELAHKTIAETLAGRVRYSATISVRSEFHMAVPDGLGEKWRRLLRCCVLQE